MRQSFFFSCYVSNWVLCGSEFGEEGPRTAEEEDEVNGGGRMVWVWNRRGPLLSSCTPRSSQSRPSSIGFFFRPPPPRQLEGGWSSNPGWWCWPCHLAAPQYAGCCDVECCRQLEFLKQQEWQLRGHFSKLTGSHNSNAKGFREKKKTGSKWSTCTARS